MSEQELDKKQSKFLFVCNNGGFPTKHTVVAGNQALAIMKHDSEFPKHEFLSASPLKKMREELDSQPIEKKPELHPGTIRKQEVSAPFSYKGINRRQRSIADTRITILKILSERKYLISTVASKMSCAPQNIRLHLEALAETGIVQIEKMGKKGEFCQHCGSPMLGKSVYSITPKGKEILTELLQHQQALDELTRSTALRPPKENESGR